MKKWSLLRIILLFFIGLTFKTTNATHIVGGVMNYRYLGNDRYEISLFVYRDCIYGIPPLDNPARIRIWDGVSESVFGFLKPFDDTLPITQPDPCASIDSGEICVNWTQYLDTIILPPNDLGYTIYYQRCCRNNSIQNLTYDSRGNGAMDWGATYTINIPPSINNLHIENSSPVFANNPPVYICVSKPLVYDNSANDSNSDSLVYKLCTPYSGGFPTDPLNQFTLEAPPFEQVIWDSLYSENNMLGGVPLTINSTTGILTGTPNTIGQFVVGICVDEYRNGELLTKTIRDFQFNVIDCNLQIISSFFAPDIQCNSFTVNFQNQSSGATSYKWYFGDGDSSTLDNPTHTYTNTGVYTVTLISINSITNSCVANYTKQISIQYKKIEADFMVDANTCLQPGNAIKFIDKSTDSFNVANWRWTFSNGDTSSLRNPILFYNGTDTSLTATLNVTSTNGCTSTITKIIKLFKKPPYNITPIITKCSNIQTAQLELAMLGNNIFKWTPSIGLNNPNIQNPTTNINTNTTYFVTIKTPLSNGDTCVQLDSVQIKTINTVQINTSDTTKVCNDSVRLSVPLSAGQTVVWSTSNTFVPIIGTTANISVAQTIFSQKYFVKIIANGCEAVDSIVALYSNIIPNITLANEILQCSNQVSINANINFFDDIIWSNSATFNPVISTINPLTTTQITKTVKYYIKANFKTCSNTDSIKITIQDTIPGIALDDSINFCTENIIINAVVRKYTSLIWSTDPAFTTIIGTTQNINVTQNIPRQVYYLRAFYRDCFITDSIVINYNQNVPTITLEDSLVLCNNLVNINAITTNSTNIIWSNNVSFTPILSNQTTLNITQNNALQNYYVKATNSFCVAIDSIKIRVLEKPIITLSDVVYVCKDSVRINSNVRNFDSIIWSTNNSFDSIISRESILVLLQTAPQKTYYIKAFNFGCESVDSITVFYNDSLPSVDLYNKTGGCVGIDKNNIVKLEAVVNFYNSFIWAKDRNFDSVITTTNLAFQIQQLDTIKWYYFKANYGFCTTNDSIKIEHYLLDFPSDIKICKDDKANLSLTIKPDLIFFSVLWKTKDTSFIIKTNNVATISFYPDTTQFVFISVFTSSGCEIINDSILITVNLLPIIDATINKPIINIGEQVQLTATQNSNYQYHWLPANLVSDSTIYNPTSSPTLNTLYTVLVNDKNNCSAKDTVSVRVENNICDKNNIYIPNAFSPNGDGINDIFKVRSSILKTMHLEIYNRWGNLVFESNDINNGWNGTYKNKTEQAEAYAYYFIGECLQGEKIALKGNVTLVK